MILNGYHVLENGYIFEVGDTPIRLASVHGYWNMIDMNEYESRITEGSFSGVNMQIDLESKIFAPSEIEFQIENADGTYAESDFIDEYVIVRLLVNANIDEEDENTGVRSWKFYITHAAENYGKISVKAVSLMQRYINGYYPRTPLISSIFTGDMQPADDMACVPKIFNSAYIPVTPGAYDNGSGDEWFYIIASGTWNASNYIFDRVFSPPELNTASWAATEYDFNGYTLTGADNKSYVGVQFLVHVDETIDGTANGIWASGEKVLSPYLWYSQANQPYVGAGPAEVLYYVMEDMGISAGDLNWGTEWQQIDADIASLTTESTEMHFGICHQEPNENFLSSYMQCFDMYLSFGEKINLHQFSATSIETFDSDKILELSYNSDFYEKNNVNGGTVAYVRDTDPDHEMGGQVIVPLATTQVTSVTNPAADVFKFRFRMADYGIPYIFGLLYFQKIYDIKTRVSISVSVDDITAWETLKPGDVITIAGSSAYGDEKQVLITEMRFTSDMTVKISGNVYYHLEDWSDITPTTNTVYEPAGTYRIDTYTVIKNHDATSNIKLVDNFVKFPTGRLYAPDHDCFQAKMAEEQTNIAEGEDVVVQFIADTYNNTGFDDDDHWFVANGDGWYQFNVNIRFKQIDVGTTEIVVKLITDIADFYYVVDARNMGVDGYPSASFSQLAWMDNGDKAIVKVNINGGAAQVDIHEISKFSGFYVNYDNLA